MIKDELVNRMLKILKQHENELRESFGIKEIGIFGSYVRGSQKEGSDIDILVEFLPYAEMDLIKFVELEESYLTPLSDLEMQPVAVTRESKMNEIKGKKDLSDDENPGNLDYQDEVPF